ncbi:LysR substrate-binding domain-containing protein [Rhodobacteraceae bacterium KMM 6894]|nr:LysR substrate-binding domain-containing protein [Rhodobacteraceae bacterium KMM 6894]
MNDTALRSFHAVALHGGFSAAARALNISQPTLSTQVKALEMRYDTALFVRKGRRVHLTSEGARLYEITTRLHQHEVEAEDLLKSFAGLQAGALRLAAVGPFHATDMIVAFKARYPGIDISVEFANTRRSLDRLLAFEADIGLVAQASDDPRIATLPYSTHEVVIFVARGHPFFDRDSLSLRELQGQKVIQRERGSQTRAAMEAALQDHGVQVDVVLDLGSREGIWKAVEQGLGIGYVSDFEFVPHPNLRAVPIRDAQVQTQYFLAWLTERQEAHLIRAFRQTALLNTPSD